MNSSVESELDRLADENRRLRIALAEAIRRPTGVVPESAWEFCAFESAADPSGHGAIARGLALGEMIRLSHVMGLA